MKNVRMLILGFISTVGIISPIGAISLKPYLTSPFKDEKGKTLAHIMAENCHRLPDFEKELIQEALGFDLKVIGLVPHVITLEASQLGGLKTIMLLPHVEDNEGTIAWDIAKEKVEETKNEQAVSFLEWLMCQELIRLELISRDLVKRHAETDKKLTDLFDRRAGEAKSDYHARIKLAQEQMLAEMSLFLSYKTEFQEKVKLATARMNETNTILEKFGKNPIEFSADVM